MDNTISYVENSNNVLEKYFNTDNLKLAYYRIQYSTDRLVKDRFGLNAFGDNLDENLRLLSEHIIEGRYEPQTGFKYYEPKASGTQRTKTLLMIEDAIVYQAIANVIAEENYDRLAINEHFVFGSVLSKETRKGTKLLEEDNPQYYFFKFWRPLFLKFKDSVIKSIKDDEVAYKFETDITGFFDSIPHFSLLMTLSKEFGVEDEILDILSVCFNAWSGTKESSTPGVGIPQGPQASFLMANLLLYHLDNQLISEAFKYYRYMDDIYIYAYSEEELRDVLVSIDNYLKGHALSINSKKTGITSINKDNEDETIKELEKLEISAKEYAAEEDNEKEVEEKIDKTLIKLSDQSPDDNVIFEIGIVETITEKEEVIDFWEEQIREVEQELPGLFKKGELKLIDPDNTNDIDFIRLSAKYGTAIRQLAELKPVSASKDLLPYWLFALKKFFWRANNYVITLQHYKGNEELKKQLLEIYEADKNYEWYRYHLITSLTYNFEYSDKELRRFFALLKEEKSELARYAIYCLIIKHSVDQQLLSTLRVQLSNEPNDYIKLITADYWKKDKDRENTMDELVKAIGL